MSGNIGVTKERLTEMVNNENMSAKQIAEHFGVKVENVKDLLKVCGLVPVTRKRKPKLVLETVAQGAGTVSGTASMVQNTQREEAHIPPPAELVQDTASNSVQENTATGDLPF